MKHISPFYKIENSKNKGFTLIEVLIASAILTISMGVLLQLFSGAIRRMHSAAEHARNLLIEQQIIEEISVINPVESNQGELMVANKKYHWQATLMQEFKVMSDTQVEDKVEKFAGLYGINVTLSGADAQAYKLNWTQMGWK